jgi:murein L,D-transpeptidase YcbB/YkuD
MPALAAGFVAAPSAQSLDSFYAERGNRPLWLSEANSGIEPRILIDLLRGAQADGLNPDDYRPKILERALRSARSGNPADILRADRLLSQAFVAYVRDLRRTPKVDIIWVDPELRPSAPSPQRLLEGAAAAPSLEAYLSGMRWMNPIYAGLREAMANGAGRDQAERDLLRLNLERARALPSSGRYLVVNATAAQLTMYEDGNVVDTMRVVVGKPINPTPMMAAQIRFASLNPYWNVPPDLAAERVAPAVVKEGIGYLRQKGYQLLASWDPDAKVIDPGTVDWKAVADGREEVRLRQLPGPSNAMGKMKFMFPNAQGIYLHDTPQKELLSEASRLFSGGCVRLEDASRLARWLFNGKVPTTKSARPEQRVDLPRPVPVFLTYLTAVPDGGSVAFLPDVYNRDRAALAALDASRSLASR